LISKNYLNLLKVQLKITFNFPPNGLKHLSDAKTNMKLGHHLFLGLLSVNSGISFIVNLYPQKLKEKQEEL
jgi:hypothetical protein